MRTYNAPYINGIVAINTLSRRITKETGESFFPATPEAQRSKAGVSGSAIKPFAIEMVKELVDQRQRNRYDFDILSVGGVTTVQDVRDYLDIGADGVQSCTGAWFNPNLAIETRLVTHKVAKPNRVTFIGVDGHKGYKGKEVNLTKERPADEPELSELPPFATNTILEDYPDPFADAEVKPIKRVKLKDLFPPQEDKQLTPGDEAENPPPIR